MKIRFIINPIAGLSRKQDLPRLIHDHIDAQKFDISIVFTEYAGHAVELSKQALADACQIVVVAGGDGSVNEVASPLVGTDVILGILPLGSGNGLARKLNISRTTIDALKAINQCQVEIIDVGKINEYYFFSCAGSGFQSKVIDSYAKDEARGLSAYIKAGLKDFFFFKPSHYDLEIDGERSNYDIFVLDISNSGQFGYGVTVCPFSDMQDGFLEITVSEKFSFWRVFYLLLLLVLGKAQKSKLIHTKKCRQATIIPEKPVLLQVDGEAMSSVEQMEISILEKSLQIIVPVS